MKPARIFTILALAAAVPHAFAQIPVYTNFIRQVQISSGTEWDMQVASQGEQLSALAIDPGGARFELWTVKQSPLTSYLLDSKLVGTYIPQAYVTITSQDPYTLIPRTRADKPFTVTINIQGLSSDPTAPEPSKQVKLQRHVQSYGTGGTGVGINRNLATLLSTSYITSNGTTTLNYALTSVPGSNRSKLWGEERFTINSIADYQTPEAALASQYIQVWPVADASITGITSNQKVLYALPVTTLQYNDLYPYSSTYAQVYAGAAVLGKQGTIVPGSSMVINDSVPQSRTVTLSNWDTAIDNDGKWTLEIITSTPFGVERLAFVTFDLDRTIEMNGSVTTLE